MQVQFCLATLFVTTLFADSPSLHRVSPLGGQAGSVVTLELVGSKLGASNGVQFDNADLVWIETLECTEAVLKGKVRIAPDAALGPHWIKIAGKNGPSNTRLFNVTQFPGTMEVEPNDTPATAQPIALRSQVVYGYMPSRIDIDSFSFHARAGERWVFDLQSIERGGFLECSLTLNDETGREVAFNEDQDEYLETPRLEFTFPHAGRYVLKIDQYRGPQGVGCGENCSYLLQISQLPVVLSVHPLGGQAGSKLRVNVHGHSLASVQRVYLTRVRSAEYYRLTFPFSMPLRFEDASVASQLTRVFGNNISAGPDQLSADFAIPPDAATGLWRLWLESPAGRTEGLSLEISELPDLADATKLESAWLQSEVILNGSLEEARKQNSYPVELKAGVPFHAWTLAAQLGLPAIDTVLELFDAGGKLLAEHDDLMTGQGTVIGNPDSSLFFTPKVSEPARLVAHDRTMRGGTGYSYRLHIASHEPSFQLLTEPEEFAIAPGGIAELEVLLIRQPGFEQGVDVWIEGLPLGAAATRGRFRADQVFGPSGDGDNINIPMVPLRITMPKTVAPGAYPVRVRGRAAAGGEIVEGFTTLWIGPRGKRNDTRRPLPRILIHVAP